MVSQQRVKPAMPLELLVPFVVAAVTVIMLVISRSGLSRPTVLTGETQVESRFRLDYPEAAIDTVLIDDAGTTALLMAGGAATGLLRAFGDRTTTRQLKPGDLAAVTVISSGLEIVSADFTWPRHRVALRREEDRARWRDALAPLATTQGAAAA